jgi:hypothetical protein
VVLDMNLYGYKQIYNLVRTQYFNELNDEILFIKEDKTFSYCKDTIGHLVTVETQLAKTEANDIMIRQIERVGLKDNMYFICPDLSEILCFLHEIGHFYNAVTTGINNTGYAEYKAKTYYNLNQATWLPWNGIRQLLSTVLYSS